MSNWDELIFTQEDNVDFLDEVAELEGNEVAQALVDAVNLALRDGQPGSVDHSVGLCAATVAAIWSGAPFSVANVADDHPFIRAHIGQCPTNLQEVSLQLLDGEYERLSATEAVEAEDLETFVEALS
ncbi:DUF4259 domain-containing protein [Corynebacterium sp. c9Ua_112]|uniref:DUF4259 domain-containing protein n=1 Tax=Corynebacterium macclintockiae TaxID=2913501 RepID=A0A9X3RTL1_9CORY|nr:MULTISPECIES: DUF4259 domain-containing protein [Corynebacterium]MBC6795229.1 DUF4259 domain-containing protein [Corynebacterium sp. LK28]MCZ9305403.1 DUF4259 domain-containing protein [Corynebacterium macclintockiae]OFM58294.1 hypothetical protein HMPREF2678_09160 [Corynebacterium sp. HMSC058E07]